jgi:hypothetical protein
MEDACAKRKIFFKPLENLNQAVNDAVEKFNTLMLLLEGSKIDMKQPKEIKKLEDSEHPILRRKIKNLDNFEDYDTPNLLSEQIEQAILFHFEPAKEAEPKIKRGRPECFIDCRMEKLKEIMRKWEIGLSKRLDKDQRSDAKFATVGRYIKRLPDVFLKYIGSKCQYKSKEITVVMKSYLK